MSNLYNILEVSETASQDDIKKAYRKLSLKYHPDRTNNKADADKFKEINKAYEMLSDPIKRKSYDTSLKFPFLAGANLDGMSGLSGFGNPGENMDVNNIFSMFFGGMPTDSNVRVYTSSNIPGFNDSFNSHSMFGGRAAQRKPSSIRVDTEITLKQAYKGCNIPVKITRWILESNVKREETETLYVDVPKGVDSGEIIVIKERGNIVDEVIRGDVKIQITVNNNTEFYRSGLDLIYRKNITLKESLCGFTSELELIDGRKFKINNQDGTIVQQNLKKVVDGLGFTRGDYVGNLVVEFNIIYPKTLSNHQIEKLKEIL